MYNIRRIAVLGHGGFAREVQAHIMNKYNNNAIVKLVTDLKVPHVDHINKIDLKQYDIIIGIGDPLTRKSVYEKVKTHRVISFIDSDRNLIDKNTIEIGRGSVICKGSILTTNISLGMCSHINLNSTIGHDVIIGDFFTCCPGVNISGDCKIGTNVFIGSNSTIRDGIKICDDTVIGMGSSVVKDIEIPGVYVGNPAKRIDAKK